MAVASHIQKLLTASNSKGPVWEHQSSLRVIASKRLGICLENLRPAPAFVLRVYVTRIVAKCSQCWATCRKTKLHMLHVFAVSAALTIPIVVYQRPDPAISTSPSWTMECGFTLPHILYTPNAFKRMRSFSSWFPFLPAPIKKYFWAPVFKLALKAAIFIRPNISS